MHSHTRRPQVKKSNWVPLIIHVSFFGVKYWSHPHYWAWLWFKLKTSEVSFLPFRSSGPSFVLPIVKLCLRVNLTKQSVVYNLSRISRASTKHGKKKRKKKKRTETTQPIQSSKHFTGYLIFFRLDAKVLLAGQAPCELNLNLNVNFWIWPGRSRRASIYFLLRVAVISLHLNKAAAETKKKKKKTGRGFTFNFSCNCTSPGTSEHHTQPHISTAVALLLPAFLMCSGHTASQAQDSSQYSSFGG